MVVIAVVVVAIVVVVGKVIPVVDVAVVTMATQDVVVFTENCKEDNSFNQQYFHATY